MIENNIPLPDLSTGGRPRKYIELYELDVSQSVFLPGLITNNISATVSRISRLQGWKFATRLVEDDGVKGVRVWRTA